MRVSHLLVLVWLLLPAVALARPKVAVAPLDGDKHGDVADIVATEAADHAKVVTPDRVGQVMDSLNLTTHSKRALRTLRARLEVDCVIYGQVERAGHKHKLELTIAGRGTSSSTFELEFTSASSKTFRRHLREELARRISAAEQAGDDARDGDGDHDGGDRGHHDRDADTDPDRGHHDRDADRGHHDRDGEDPDAHHRDDPDAHHRDDPDAHHRDDHRHRVAARDDDPDASVHRRDDDDDGDDGDRDRGSRRHHHHHTRELPRHVVTQSALWFDIGPGGAHRTLTYGTVPGGGAPPPPVGTGAFAGQLDAVLYPGAFSTLHGAAAGFGLAASYGQALGLAIRVPGTAASAPIDEKHYTVGVRYRFVFGQSSLALGLDYWAQRDVANRMALGNAALDMPDTSYTAIAPGAVGRFAVAPKVGILAGVQLPLMLSSGQITSGTGFGIANVVAFGGEGGVDIALAPRYGLRLAVSYDRIGLSFRTPKRGVTSAADSLLTGTAMLSLIY